MKFDWKCLALSLILTTSSLSLSLDTNAHQDGDLKLVDGPLPTMGTVLVFRSYGWGRICDDHWTMKEAQVVCRQLKMGYALEANRRNHYGSRISGAYLMDEVRCTGAENRITDCQFAGWGIHDCKQNEEVGVKCAYEAPIVQRSATNPLSLKLKESELIRMRSSSSAVHIQWPCRDLNPGHLTCEASVLPPIERRPSNCPVCDGRLTRKSGLPNVKIQMHPVCVGGVVVTRSRRMSDVRGSNPGTATGYALLYSVSEKGLSLGAQQFYSGQASATAALESMIIVSTVMGTLDSVNSPLPNCRAAKRCYPITEDPANSVRLKPSVVHFDAQFE
ncbi:scavenger receptor cysteine-rich domain-containing group B protein [Clonorchis sinensis]|uniref:Scavenger receptor cysteine-rich domain-containing group B protein n=1 Tax=Clonorchis sinensis TaxID=79923 RepID=G7YUY9_CLOSI|nr:scavenger receptor cysteine-rich domain-containing group B protein [Clonorchis sinensis]